jgi:cytidine deaminase
VSDAAGDDALVQRALEARDTSYSPYSGYAVGAALRAGDEVYAGANVENASYGLTICAERTAIARAVLEGVRAIDAIAIATTSSPPASPCGMCLQTMLEFSPDPRQTRVILVNPAGERRAFTLAELVPHGFVPASLER